jgi:hypothetical protein
MAVFRILRCLVLGLALAASANALSCSPGTRSEAGSSVPGSYSANARSGSVASSLPLPPSVEVSGKWSFGVIADTQWVGDDDGSNPNSVAVGIINVLNEELIKRGVKLVVAVGDLTDQAYAGHPEYLDTRATYAQALYNAGIAFYPLRGNHEDIETAATEFVRVFPQTRNGVNNRTPPDAFVKTSDDDATHPVRKTGPDFTVGANFTSPSADLSGLSYAFDFGNARFVLLDQFKVPGSTNTIARQQAWVSSTLANRPPGSHAFVFAHKGLITQTHADTLFGSDPSQDPAAQDALITAMATYGVRYFIHGHDHMHDRSLVTTTDGSTARVTQLVCASDSSKFYIPERPSNDETYNVRRLGHRRQTPLAQELNTVGYYVATVDGPRVTLDYYSAPVNATRYGRVYAITKTPKLSFTRRETFGYSQNGGELVVAQGQALTIVHDRFGKTTVRVLSGQNTSTAKDGSDRPFSKAINSGFAPATADTESDVVWLWGMASALGSDETDPFALAITFEPKTATRKELELGRFGLVTLDETGTWRNAAMTLGGHPPRFVSGPWAAAYGPGAYGVDAATSTSWAVVNHGGAFAVARLSAP